MPIKIGCCLLVTGCQLLDKNSVELKFEFKVFVVIQPSTCLTTEQQNCLNYEQLVSMLNMN